MSDTPRTDEAVKQILQTSQHERVKADFARELEKELNQLINLKRDALKDINRITQLEVKLQTSETCYRTMGELCDYMWMTLMRVLPEDSEERKALRDAGVTNAEKLWESTITQARLLTALKPVS